MIKYKIKARKKKRDKREMTIRREYTTCNVSVYTCAKYRNIINGLFFAPISPEYNVHHIWEMVWQALSSDELLLLLLLLLLHVSSRNFFLIHDFTLCSAFALAYLYYDTTFCNVLAIYTLGIYFLFFSWWMHPLCWLTIFHSNCCWIFQKLQFLNWAIFTYTYFSR